jgi:hypothetical protein
MAGTNNLAERDPAEQSDSVVSEVTDGIEAILNVMRQKAPQATVALSPAAGGRPQQRALSGASAGFTIIRSARLPSA